MEVKTFFGLELGGFRDHFLCDVSLSVPFYRSPCDYMNYNG